MKRKTASKIVGMMLAVIMTFTMLPTSAIAGFVDSPLTGVTGSGWDNIDTPPPTNDVDNTLIPEINNTSQDTQSNSVSGSDSDTIIIPPTPQTEDEEESPAQSSNTPEDETDTTPPQLQDHWLQQYQADMIALQQRSMMSRAHLENRKGQEQGHKYAEHNPQQAPSGELGGTRGDWSRP